MCVRVCVIRSLEMAENSIMGAYSVTTKLRGTNNVSFFCLLFFSPSDKLSACVIKNGVNNYLWKQPFCERQIFRSLKTSLRKVNKMLN